MNPSEYIAARAEHNRLKRGPEEFDILALGLATATTGFKVLNVRQLLQCSQVEATGAVNDMVERGLVQSLTSRLYLTMKGTERGMKLFPDIHRKAQFEMALGHLGKLIDTDKPSDFREANNFLAKMKMEGGRR